MGDFCQELQCTSSDGYVFVSPGKMINLYYLSSFKNTKLIGKGGEGTVFKGCDENDQCVAIKIFDKEYDAHSKREIQFLLNHSHAHIVSIIGLILDEPGTDRQETPGYKGYVMNYMGHGSLADVISDITKEYSLRTARLWISQISAALQYLHKHGILHRDVKPHNILLAADNCLKLADFGTSRNEDTDDLSSWVGTCPYMAPEIVTKKYDSKADIYSLGITIWQIMHRQYPFTLDELGRASFELRLDTKKMNKYVYQFVERCWISEVDKRPSAEEIVHYFNKIGKGFLPSEESSALQDLSMEIDKELLPLNEMYVNNEMNKRSNGRLNRFSRGTICFPYRAYLGMDKLNPIRMKQLREFPAAWSSVFKHGGNRLTKKLDSLFDETML